MRIVLSGLKDIDLFPVAVLMPKMRFCLKNPDSQALSLAREQHISSLEDPACSVIYYVVHNTLMAMNGHDKGV